MDYFSFDTCYFKSNIICCELVLKIKQYANVLQFESSRISALQLECNQLLDKFYASKEDFDFLVKEALPIKYLAEDDPTQSEEYIHEFSEFFKNIWQMGKYKFSEKGKRSQYICFVGSPLMDVMSTIQSFVDEVMVRLTYMPYHSECSATMHAICSQIYAELHGDCLGTADACLRQYTYLQAAIPFLQELKNLIHQYLLLPDVNTPKQFVDRVILQIPSVDILTLQDDTEDMLPFRSVVDLLNGKLFDSEILDHNSDIKPVVEDDINLKRSVVVVKTVEWIMQQYKSQDVSNVLKIPIPPSVSLDLVERKRACYVEKNAFASPLVYRSPRLFNYQMPVELTDTADLFDMNKIDWSGICNSPMSSQRRFSRRGRKNGPTLTGMSTTNDLQPIKLHTLQTPLLPPLL